MDAIRIEWRDGFEDLETFRSVRQAMLCEPVSSVRQRGYAVLFEIDGRFAVWIAYEDRYYYQFLPKGAIVLYGGFWEKHHNIIWNSANNISQREREIYGNFLADYFDNGGI